MESCGGMEGKGEGRLVPALPMTPSHLPPEAAAARAFPSHPQAVTYYSYVIAFVVELVIVIDISGAGTIWTKLPACG